MAQTTKDTIKQRILQAGEEAWLGEEGLAKLIVLAKDLASSAGMLRFFFVASSWAREVHSAALERHRAGVSGSLPMMHPRRRRVR